MKDCLHETSKLSSSVGTPAHFSRSADGDKYHDTDNFMGKKFCRWQYSVILD